MNHNSRAKHRKRSSRYLLLLLAAAVTMNAGLAMICGGLILLLRYSPYGDPGAEAPGAWLFFAGLALVILPLAVAVLLWLARIRRRYRDWKETLPAAERTAVELTEFAVLTGTALAWHKRAEERQDRLAARVMGVPPENR